VALWQGGGQPFDPAKGQETCFLSTAKHSLEGKDDIVLALRERLSVFLSVAALLGRGFHFDGGNREEALPAILFPGLSCSIDDAPLSSTIQRSGKGPFSPSCCLMVTEKGTMNLHTNLCESIQNLGSPENLAKNCRAQCNHELSFSSTPKDVALASQSPLPWQILYYRDILVAENKLNLQDSSPSKIWRVHCERASFVKCLKDVAFGPSTETRVFPLSFSAADGNDESTRTLAVT